ncbi:unnamed protein product [Phytomonas sp. Hart1]|nr:unnamed protein product [Phytomonas sp. Hart1]|eukprot:CCW69163.1 unnamed protein product [Phytomonas sp. isolate Hart1]
MAKPSQKGKKVGASDTSTSKLKNSKASEPIAPKSGKQSSAKSSVSKVSTKEQLSSTPCSTPLIVCTRKRSLEKHQPSTTDNHDSENLTTDSPVPEPTQVCEEVNCKRPKNSVASEAQDPLIDVTDRPCGLASPGDLTRTPELSPFLRTTTYDFRFSDAELRSFLLDATSFLCYLWCRVTTHITLQVPNSAAFLSVGERGRMVDSTALSSTAANEENEGAYGEGSETIFDWKALLMDSSKVHEEVYRTVRSTIAASCALSHRSCQALWGPCGSGKHRIVRLVTEECSKQANTFVIQLHGKLLRGDEAAIRVIAQQMLDFLKSPHSEAVRRADWSIRTGTFDFGQLFHFEKELAMEPTTHTHHGGADPMSGEGHLSNGGEHVRDGALGPQEGDQGGRRRGFAPAAAVMGGTSNRAMEAEKPWLSTAGRGAIKNTKHISNQDGPSVLNNDAEFDSSNDEDDDGGGYPFITSTTTYLSGGAASALPHLQRALLLLKHHGTNLVVCLRHADQFSVWCDRLLYVLSGLMHESDGQGGGMSLLLTSSASDVRQMEKRLSSRLTCITCYVPLLTWTPATLLRAVISILVDWCEWKLDEIGLRQDEEAHRRQMQNQPDEMDKDKAKIANQHPCKGSANNVNSNDKPNSDVDGADEALGLFAKRTAELSRQKASLHHLLPFPPDEASFEVAPVAPEEAVYFNHAEGGPRLKGRRPRKPTKGGSDVPKRPSLYAHPTLALEMLAFVCKQQLRRLDEMGTRAADGSGSWTLANGSSPEWTDSADFSLISNILRLTDDLFAAGGTPQASLAALVQCLTKCSSGALDLIRPEDQIEVLEWLRQRQGREEIWPWMEAVGHDDDACKINNLEGSPRIRVGLPRFRQCAPMNLRRGPRAPALRKENTAPSSAVLDSALLVPHLWGLLDEGQLVRLGYFSRESVQILFYMLIHQEAGIDRRSIADLLEDVSSSLGVKAAAALDRAAYRASIEQLIRWNFLKMQEIGESVSLNIGASRLREALKEIFSRQADWCEDILGIDPKDYMRMRSLIG